MSRAELELCRKLLAQGLELERATVVRLVDEALKHWPARPHPDGCAWWRGAGCDHEPEVELGAPFDEKLKAST